MKNQKKLILSVFVMGALLAMTQTVSAIPVQDVPDAGASSVLLGLAVGGLALVRKSLKK